MEDQLPTISQKVQVKMPSRRNQLVVPLAACLVWLLIASRSWASDVWLAKKVDRNGWLGERAVVLPPPATTSALGSYNDFASTNPEAVTARDVSGLDGEVAAQADESEASHHWMW